MVCLVLAIAAVYAAFGLGRASAGGDPVATPQQVVVEPGDSLWSIAVRVLPQRDPRDAVGDLKALNHLSTSQLRVGQQLQVP